MSDPVLDAYVAKHGAQPASYTHGVEWKIRLRIWRSAWQEATLIEQEWFPIETAPKDGSEFVTCNMRQGGVRRLVSWNLIHNFWQSKGEPIQLQETHWMPLPKNPRTKP